MFSEERKQIIVKTVNEYGRVSVQDLVQLLDISESTIRRDLAELDKQNLLTKVHGGAIASTARVTQDLSVSVRQDMNIEQKRYIAELAASFLKEGDVVYLDAGTTTGHMIDFLTCKDITFVTNSVDHGQRLTSMGYLCYLPGGILKDDTKAIVGHPACKFLEGFNFTKCFIGTNGVTRSQGCTTPSLNEADIKGTACQQSSEVYVLADNTKFGVVSSLTFCKYSDAKIITDRDVPEKYRASKNIIAY